MPSHLRASSYLPTKFVWFLFFETFFSFCAVCGSDHECITIFSKRFKGKSTSFTLSNTLWEQIDMHRHIHTFAQGIRFLLVAPNGFAVSFNNTLELFTFRLCLSSCDCVMFYICKHLPFVTDHIDLNRHLIVSPIPLTVSLLPCSMRSLHHYYCYFSLLHLKMKMQHTKPPKQCTPHKKRYQLIIWFDSFRLICFFFFVDISFFSSNYYAKYRLDWWE